MRPQKRFPISALLALAAVPVLMAGCSRPTPPPLATETPAQMQQSIQTHAADYKAFRQNNPNAYHPGVK